MHPIATSIVASAGTALVSDLAGYVRAVEQWRNQPPSTRGDRPGFDWALCLGRLGTGLLLGLLAGLGINAGVPA